MYTVAITETSKGHRVWIQALASKGITSPRVDVLIQGGTITLTFSEHGKRKVTRAKGGIVDLTSKAVTRWADGHSEAQIRVLDSHTIVITRGI